MSIAHILSICKEADARLLAYYAGLVVERDLWAALTHQIPEAKLREVQGFLAIFLLWDKEDTAELTLAESPLDLASLPHRMLPRLARAILRKYAYCADKTPIMAFVEKLRAYYREEALVQQLLELGEALSWTRRDTPTWDALVEQAPRPCHSHWLSLAIASADSFALATDEQLYLVLRAGAFHCEECERVALAKVEPERLKQIEERLWNAQLSDEMVEQSYAGY